MTESERYLFDLNGYLVVEDMLMPEQVRALNEAIDHNPDQIRIREGELALSGGAERHGAKPSPFLEGAHGRGDIQGILDWPEPWCQPFRDLLSHPAAVRYMLEMIGNGFRYVNANGISMTEGNEGHVFHGGGTPVGPFTYRFQDGKMVNTLMAVCYQLVDIHPGDGGFGCLPGSHKSNLPCSWEARRLEVDEIRAFVQHVPMKAGSALVFTEALTHGSIPWTASHERRTLLYRYGPGELAYGGLARPGSGEYPPFYDALTPLQKAIMEPPYLGSVEKRRPDIALLLEEEEKERRSEGGD